MPIRGVVLYFNISRILNRWLFCLITEPITQIWYKHFFTSELLTVIEKKYYCFSGKWLNIIY